jgi:adenylate kinase family enzyme
VALLLRKLLEPIYRDGVILDGFPRTPVQVECLKLLGGEDRASSTTASPRRPLASPVPPADPST